MMNRLFSVLVGVVVILACERIAREYFMFHWNGCGSAETLHCMSMTTVAAAGPIYKVLRTVICWIAGIVFGIVGFYIPAATNKSGSFMESLIGALLGVVLGSVIGYYAHLTVPIVAALIVLRALHVQIRVQHGLRVQ